jgi:bacteriorhodopsin
LWQAVGHVRKRTAAGRVGAFYCGTPNARINAFRREATMFLILFGVLVVLWLMGFLAFHIAGGLIHILLIVAVICLILHFVRGR